MVEKFRHLITGKGRALGRHLHFDQPSAPGQDEIAIRPRLAVLGIVEVEHRLAGIDAAGNGSDVIDDRIAGDRARLDQLVYGQPQRDPAPGDGGAAGAAIGLDHIAIDHDLAFTQSHPVHTGPQCAPDKPLNFLCSAGLLACRRLAPVAGIGRPRQHPVFRRNPTEASALQEGWRLVLHRRGAQNMRVPTFDQTRPFGMFRHPRLDGDGAHLIEFPAGGSHEKSFLAVAASY